MLKHLRISISLALECAYGETGLVLAPLIIVGATIVNCSFESAVLSLISSSDIVRLGDDARWKCNMFGVSSKRTISEH